MRLAKQFRCEHYYANMGVIIHMQGNGAPPRKTCSGCGGRLLVEEGYWGVWRWNQAGAYLSSTCKGEFVIKAAAERLADRLSADCLDPSGYVVRWWPA